MIKSVIVAIVFVASFAVLWRYSEEKTQLELADALRKSPTEKNESNAVIELPIPHFDPSLKLEERRREEDYEKAKQELSNMTFEEYWIEHDHLQCILNWYTAKIRNGVSIKFEEYHKRRMEEISNKLVDSMSADAPIESL